MNVNLKSLVARLNDTTRNALEGAAGLCLSRTNYDVEVEHILFKLLEQDDTDLHKICAHYEVNIDRLTKDVSTALDRLKSGNSRTPGLSDRIPKWIQDAWLLASVDFGAAITRYLQLRRNITSDAWQLIARLTHDLDSGAGYGAETNVYCACLTAI